MGLTVIHDSRQPFASVGWPYQSPTLSGVNRRTFVVGGALLLAGCTKAPGSTTQGGVEKAGDGKLRHDLEPLVKRLPVLADATAASWASGTLGNDRVPGPSLYWIDAVVELDDDTAAEARALAGDDADLPSDLHPVVQPEAPESDYVSFDELSDFFSDGAWRSRAWLAKDRPVVVLTVTGE